MPVQTQKPEAAQMMAIKAAQELAPVALGLFPDSEIYLFGSYAKGAADEYSDVDVAVLLGEEASALPWRERDDKEDELWDRAWEINPLIEPTVRKCTDRTGFVEEIRRTGIRIA